MKAQNKSTYVDNVSRRIGRRTTTANNGSTTGSLIKVLFSPQDSLAHFWRRHVTEFKQFINALGFGDRGIVAKYGEHFLLALEGQCLVFILEKYVASYSTFH